MRRALVLVAVLLFAGSLAAWADGGAGSGPLASRCALPDLTGLTPDQAAATALAAGLQVSAADPSTPLQACPATVYCPTGAGCGPGPACSTIAVGKCCSSGSITLCCANEIVVVRCPCKCTRQICATQCSQSTQTTWSCS
jgi:hypothetical protein